MTKKFVLVLALLAFAGSCNHQHLPPKTSGNLYSDNIIELKGKRINVDEAKTVAERTLGLSGRTEIAIDQGMLFYFDSPGKPSFWMKDMKFPIDIVWILNDEVVDITAEVPIEENVATGNLKSYLPKSEVNRVLELKSGWSSKHDLKVGDKVKLSLDQS